MKDKLLLGIGAVLVLLALIKPDIGGFITPHDNNIVVENIDSDSKTLVQPIIDVLKSGPSDRRIDGKKLASLFSDIATLIQLDGEDQVITNTEEIRQANTIAGRMLKLNLKDKYPSLGIECSKYVKFIIGDDNVQLDSDLRNKAVQAFRSLAWACNEGSK
jgi:hypothetical protein